MSTVMPEGDAIRRAVKWVSECRESEPETDLRQLVEEAISRFDLSPKDADFLIHFYRSEKAC